ncbi:MAG TPA: DNA alkylation repair protein [Phycisphaerae bacterium]|nr:DNA alkylation repair protein [Phycisphaerae bacterium]
MAARKVSAKKKRATTRGAVRSGKRAATSPPAYDAASAVAELKRLSSRAYRDGMSRFGIPSDNALGVPVGQIQKLGKKIGRDHTLAVELWKTGVYEARLLCAFIDEPERVTAAQMDAWARDFDNWAVCDTLCFHLFDRTPLAFGKIRQWAKRKDEFVKRAAFALLASIGVHDKTTGDAPFAKCLPLIEKGAYDDRNFVRKGVSWALRVVGRRSASLHAAALGLATKLAASDDKAARWVGKDAYRELSSAKVRALVAKKGK